MRGASTLPHSQQAQGFTQSQEPEQEFTLLPLLTMSAQKKNFMHSKTVKCTPTNYRTQNNRRARDTQTKKSTEVKKSSDCKNCILFKRASKIPT